ncbi:MAG: TonB-dependent receptor [Sphingomonadales bacterium]|nr:TonB-dependent receptor [Sphingomonadales bacterium]
MNSIFSLRLLNLAGVSVLSLMPAVAFAQTATTSPAEGTVNSTEDIVVTAQRRSERLSEVPLTINVQTREKLAQSGIVTFKELGQITPGLNFTFIGGAAQPTMRGISSQSTAAGAENNVAIYVDGVYQSNIYGNSFDLPDVDRVEVLKGPQGTLYGRNATGGAILVYTRNPEFKTAGDFEISDGIFNGGGNDFRAKGFFTTPLTEQLAFSLSGQYANNAGYFHDVLRDKRAGKITSHNVRAKLLYEPSGGVSFLLNAYYGKKNDRSVFAGQNRNSPFPNTPTREYDIANDTDGFVATTTYGVNLKASFESDAGTFTSITGYSRVKPRAVADADGSPTPGVIYDLRQPGESFSEDVSFASRQVGIFSFLVGATAYHGKEEFTPLAVRAALAGPTFYEIVSSSRTDAFAGFLETTAKVTPTITVTAGMRYSYENREARGQLIVPVVPEQRASASFRDWTPRVSIRYSPDRDYNFYVSYGEGFKSGMFDTSGLPGVAVRPESMKAWEAGFKTSPLAGLQLNGAVYRYTVADLQTQTNNAQGLAVLANAGKARIEGAELEINYRVTPKFRLSGSGSYIPTAKYIDYANAAFVVPVAGGGGADATVANLAGTRIAKTPKWQLNALAAYETSVSFGRIGASANVSYSSYFFYELSRFVHQDHYALLNGQISWSPENSGLKVSLWGKNLTNKTTINNYLVNASGFNVVYQAPREVGLSIGYQF